MQKHASSDIQGRYPILFQHIPAHEDSLFYYDNGAVHLPYSQDFPKLHYHDRYEIGVCISGDGLFLSGGSFASVSAGDYIFIPPGCPHYSRSLDADKPCTCVFAYVNGEAVRASIALHGKAFADSAVSICGRFPSVIRWGEHPHAAELLSRVTDPENGTDQSLGAAAVMRLAAFILEGCRSFGVTSPHGELRHEGSDAISKIAEYIALRYSENYTCKALAEICHLSESQFRRRFIAAYGMPPVAYRNYLRTSIAAELLMRTEFSVAEISAKLGFTCSSDFFRAFRKQYGVSPSEYRKRKNPKEE